MRSSLLLKAARSALPLAFGIILGSLLFWLVMATGVAAPLRSAVPAVTAPTVVSYQGRISEAGTAFDGTGYFKFAVIDGSDTYYWSNDGTASGEPSSLVPMTVTNGLFTIMLGDTTLSGMSQPLSADLFNGSERYLRIWFADTVFGPFVQLTPDQRIGSVPFALRASVAEQVEVVQPGAITLCDNAAAGTLRWSGDSLEICDGVTWMPIYEPPPAVLYVTADQPTNLGGRSGADAICAAAANRPDDYPATRAFISVNSGDTIAGMPANYAIRTDISIVSPNGTVIAESWSDLLDGSIETTLEAAGVTNSRWWSGTNSDGSLGAGTCNGWTSTSTGVTGTYGHYGYTDGNWLNIGINPCGISATWPILCLAYYPES